MLLNYIAILTDSCRHSPTQSICTKSENVSAVINGLRRETFLAIFTRPTCALELSLSQQLRSAENGRAARDIPSALSSDFLVMMFCFNFSMSSSSFSLRPFAGLSFFFFEVKTSSVDTAAT